MQSHEQNLERFKQLESVKLRIAALQKNPGDISGELHYWQKQATETRNELILANRGLVGSHAKKYRDLGLEIEDLEQEGIIGLGKAIEKFEYRRDCQLSTYAEYWIKQAMFRALSKQSRTIRIPEDRLSEMRKLKAVAEKFRKEFGSEPSVEEIAWEMNIPERRVRALLVIEQPTISMHTPVGHTDGATIIDFIADSSVVDPGKNIDLSIHHKWLKESFETLTDRECEVLKLRHGIANTRRQSLEQIGIKFGVCSERIRQIHNKAYEKVVCFIREKESSGFLKKVRQSAAIKNQANKAKRATAIAPPKRPDFGLKTRNTNANPNHHIWNNNGTWYCKFRVYDTDGETKQIRTSLNTQSEEEARILRDEKMADYSEPQPHAAA